tara:strand:+ start:7734 stop:8189 length:456 start_codon:yes stop_codon:yes gene_type:complete
MQNYLKSQTRLAFVQFIFQSEIIKLDTIESADEFQKYFYNSNIAIMGEKKDFKLKFNKNFLKKLSENYINNFDKKKIIIQLNKYIDLDRKFEKWNNVLKSLIFALISELEISEDKKVKIILNDYINISKSLVSSKETKLMNAIIQKFIDEK